MAKKLRNKLGLTFQHMASHSDTVDSIVNSIDEIEHEFVMQEHSLIPFMLMLYEDIMMRCAEMLIRHPDLQYVKERLGRIKYKSRVSKEKYYEIYGYNQG